MTIHGYITGFLIALFLLVGRWTPGRVSGDSFDSSWVSEPRLWCLLMVFAVVGVAPVRSLSAQPDWMQSRRFIRVTTAWFCLFLLYAALSAFWAPSLEVAGSKAYEVGLLVAASVAVLLAFQTCDCRAIGEAFWLSILGMTAMMAALALLGSVGNRVSVLGGGANVFGRNMALMVVAALHYVRRPGLQRQILTFALAVLGVMLVVLSGSRGALAGLVCAVCVYFFLERAHFSKKVALMVSAIGVVLMVVTFSSYGERVETMFKHRVLQLTFEQGYTSGRVRLYREAYALGAENALVGTGLSGFAQHRLGAAYPHNIFLESFCETGLIGLSLFCCALLVACYSIWRRRKWISGAPTAGFVVCLVTAQTSGDFYDSRGIFVTFAMALVPVLQARPQAERAALLGNGRKALVDS